MDIERIYSSHAGPFVARDQTWWEIIPLVDSWFVLRERAPFSTSGSGVGCLVGMPKSPNEVEITTCTTFGRPHPDQGRAARPAAAAARTTLCAARECRRGEHSKKVSSGLFPVLLLLVPFLFASIVWFVSTHRLHLIYLSTNHVSLYHT